MTTSIQLKITTHRSAIAAGIGATVAGVALAKALSAK
jgi:hypothetical protein